MSNQMEFKIRLVTSDPDMSSRGNSHTWFYEPGTREVWQGAIEEAVQIAQTMYPPKTPNGHTPFTRAEIVVVSDGTW